MQHCSICGSSKDKHLKIKVGTCATVAALTKQDRARQCAMTVFVLLCHILKIQS